MAMRILYIYIILATCHLVTIAAPALQNNRGTSTILVAASDQDETETESGGEVQSSNHGNTADNCHDKTANVIEDCLTGFEVQYVVFDATRTEVRKWHALRELCRQHDFTLLCIHRALLLCPATDTDRRLIAMRLGHLRDFMAEQCPIVRAQGPPTTTTSTSTTTARTTTTSHTTSVSTSLRHSSHGQFAEGRQDSLTSRRPKAHLQEFSWGSRSSSLAPSVTPKINSLGSSRERFGETNKDLPSVDPLCETHEGQNSIKCLFQAIKSSSVSTKMGRFSSLYIFSILTALWLLLC